MEFHISGLDLLVQLTLRELESAKTRRINGDVYSDGDHPDEEASKLTLGDFAYLELNPGQKELVTLETVPEIARTNYADADELIVRVNEEGYRRAKTNMEVEVPHKNGRYIIQVMDL